MRTLFISHPDCLRHDPGSGHPECPRRLSSIQDRLVASGVGDFLDYREAPMASDAQLLRVHEEGYLELLRAAMPDSGYRRLDLDTIVNPDSLPAARRAAGAAVLAVDLIMAGAADNAFCGVRPPGHHAERDRPLGFCLFNNIAVGVAQAVQAHGLERVAVVDFDVHQGNGTEQAFADDPRVLFCSSFQHPFYPFTGLPENTPLRVNVPLAAGSGSAEFRAGVTEQWLPALERFQPQMVFVSAGFDAHRDDDMAHLNFTDEDYRWVSERIVEVAGASARNRVISSLEGGYDFDSLARCVEIHLRVLLGIR